MKNENSIINGRLNETPDADSIRNDNGGCNDPGTQITGDFPDTRAPDIDSLTTTDTTNVVAINNMPDAGRLWEELGGHFDSFSQIMYELVDDSISNFIGNTSLNRTILIEIIDKGDYVQVKLEDTGTGIKNLDAAFTLCDTSGRESPFNAHGLGLKHALSSANPENDNWMICTRTDEDIEKSVYKEISAKYTFDNFAAKIRNDKWPGNFNSSGTIIEFQCHKELFETVTLEAEENNVTFEHLVNIFVEDLGFTYAIPIKESKAIITVNSINSAGIKTSKNVVAVEPDWVDYYPPYTGTEKYDLGGGLVELHFTFGRVRDRCENNKYYKHNMETSGCEIRINGRVLAFNLLKEIWGISNHPSYNAFLAVINVISDDINALPKTRTSKNGFRQGDPMLLKLFEKIRAMRPSPVKDGGNSDNEAALFRKLANQKEIHLRGNPTVTTEMRVFTTLGEKIRLDMYVSNGDEVIPYEGKKDKSTPLNVYQLMLYWDGLVQDGIRPTEAVLIAARHPDSVYRIVELVNQRHDIKGNRYNFVIRTWSDEGISFSSA